MNKTPALIEQARELRAQGLNWKTIAAALGCGPNTAKMWLDEEYKQRQLETARNSYAKGRSKIGREPRFRMRDQSIPRAPITLAPVPPRREG